MIKAIVTDIEGTTSSLSFVKDELFPYARQRLPEFIAQHAEQSEVRKLLDEVAALAKLPGGFIGQLTDTLLDWINQDQKLTPLKTLQGLIWREGYERGELRGHIYPDALSRLHHWHDAGIRLYIYSSGSVAAQKMLFSHTEQGDLTPLFSGFFDTRIGGKKEPASYQTIATAINLPTEQILFLSDSEQELDAAESIGFNTIALARPGEGPGSKRHLTVASFTGVDW